MHEAATPPLDYVVSTEYTLEFRPSNICTPYSTQSTNLLKLNSSRDRPIRDQAAGTPPDSMHEHPLHSVYGVEFPES